MLNRKAFIIFLLFSISVMAGCGVIDTGGSDKNADDKTKTTTSASTESEDDFIKLGQDSFGVDVKSEITDNQVAKVLGKPIVKVEDYSNNSSTGAKYYINETSFVIIDVGYTAAADQKKGLEVLERKVTSDSSIGLDNFIAISDKAPGEYIDIYMVVDPAKKFVRVGKSSVDACDNATLITLAKLVEEKIRSFK